jgi:hypothetical protein
MKYENGNFLLFDNNSKFGTTVLLRRGYQIESEPKTLQIGSTIITLSLIPAPEKKIYSHLAFEDDDDDDDEDEDDDDDDKDEKTQIPGKASGPASNIKSSDGNLKVPTNS